MATGSLFLGFDSSGGFDSAMVLILAVIVVSPLYETEIHLEREGERM
jgi:hypothetical protein